MNSFYREGLCLVATGGDVRPALTNSRPSSDIIFSGRPWTQNRCEKMASATSPAFLVLSGTTFTKRVRRSRQVRTYLLSDLCALTAETMSIAMGAWRPKLTLVGRI